jgi:hypothetical protein
MNNDRKQLIRLAAARPVGDPVRRVLLGEIQKEAAGSLRSQVSKVADKFSEDVASELAKLFKGNGWKVKAHPSGHIKILSGPPGDPNPKEIQFQVSNPSVQARGSLFEMKAYIRVSYTEGRLTHKSVETRGVQGMDPKGVADWLFNPSKLPRVLK